MMRYIFIPLILFISLLVTAPAGAEKLLKEDAVKYREKGYKFQKSGDIEQAKKYYQKAAAMSSDYAPVHNDLGVVYEIERDYKRAEAEFVRAIIIDSNYVKAHINLALLYEKTRRKQKALFHWKKVLEAGDRKDLWSKRAEERVEKLLKEERNSLGVFGLAEEIISQRSEE